MSDDKKLLREKMSKRIAGAVLIAGGLAMTIILFIQSIDAKIADPDTAKSLINGLMLTGSALLGVDALQSVFKK